ncbi:ATP synthase F0 subunit 8 (mitochondrion) [Aotus nancymaae]|uniref:ATP synthase complex subunit 8 n=1 Tax=Aotus nancymaae TaxID=37293 RepID=I6MI14_AOTNA|nr:ATP synthase F0 subunit 8 [Aotus nancymaae]AEL04106.1 ATP synthase F0 subunit 8 [Aotus nancymaae]QXI73006.1 ATP synthase F0 subunit 8 [Aotus nancymaae]QXI73008.1 ATP synthase F0 subunit 8 [Aotus nancymaae]
MPQLDISPWPMVILSMIVALFYFIQLKLLNFTFHNIPSSKPMKTQKHKMTWELKWTKIYLPLSTYQ